MSVGTSELTIEEAKAQLDALLDVFDGDGEKVMKELPLYVIKLENDLKEVFNLQGDIKQVEEAFAAKECSPEGIRSGKAHPELVRINQYIAKAIEDGLERLGQMQRFVVMHTPIEEDGNNFGVAVQSRFYAKVSKYVKWCESLQEGCKAYHAIRADILRKMELDEKLEVRENYSENADKVSSSRTVKTVNDKAPMGDLLCVELGYGLSSYLARHDANHYFQLKTVLQGLISM